MDIYIGFVTEHVLLSAFLQFALLGTIGEILGSFIASASSRAPFGLKAGLLKAAAWGMLGITIKFAFTGFVGFTDRLLSAELLPPLFAGGFLRAFAVSCFMNLLFGPQMMFLHRFSDNIISGHAGYGGIKGSLMTLLWFWIPAHTLTFLMPVPLRIGMAALWSVALGCIMGFYKRKAAR